MPVTQADKSEPASGLQIFACIYATLWMLLLFGGWFTLVQMRTKGINMFDLGGGLAFATFGSGIIAIGLLIGAFN